MIDDSASNASTNTANIFTLPYVFQWIISLFFDHTSIREKLPRVKTEFGRKRFYYLAGKECHDLPLSARKIKSRLLLITILKIILPSEIILALD